MIIYQFALTNHTSIYIMVTTYGNGFSLYGFCDSLTCRALHFAFHWLNFILMGRHGVTMLHALFQCNNISNTMDSTRKQLISFVCHCNSSLQRLWNDMAHGGLPGDDISTLVQFEAVKFEALLRELDLDLQNGDVSVRAVENASSQLIDLQSKRASPEMKEHLRELKGRVIEYEDWHELSPADAARMLFERFHHLLMVLHMSNEIPSDVSLFSIDNRLAELRPKISRRRMTCLNMIYSDLQGWRQLVACGSEVFAQRNFFWSKLPAVRPKSPARKAAAQTRHQSSAATRRQEQSEHEDRTSKFAIPGKSPAHTSQQPAAASRRPHQTDKQPNAFEMPFHYGRAEAARGTASRKDSRSYSTSSESSGQRRSRPCDAAPHCADFEQKHGSTKKRKVDPRRREEYQYLYAAQAHCLQCLEYYGALSDFDLDCTSSGRNARQWAAIDESSKPCLIPDSIEQWLLSKNL